MISEATEVVNLASLNRVLIPILLLLVVGLGAVIYGTTLNINQQGNSSHSTTGTTCPNCTTIEAIIAGTFPTAQDKSGTGGVTVTVQGLRVLYVTNESDGDWHVGVTDGHIQTFITEIIPRDQAAEGRPLVGSVIDEIGVPFCDTFHQNEAWHGDTCWEIHPVTSWSISAQSVGQETTYSAPTFKVAIDFAQNPIARGSTQTITVAINDSDGPLANQAVHIHVLYASGFTTKDFDCTTGADGACSSSWVIGSNSDPGTFDVSVTVATQGFGASFEVKP